MPVPAHLQPQSPVQNTEYRQRLAAAPGGYGAWYSAPSYGPARKGLTFGKVAAILLLVGGLAAIGMVGLAFMAGVANDRRAAQVEVVDTDPLSARLPGESAQLTPLFDELDQQLDRGVETNTVNHSTPTSRIELVPAVLKSIDTVTRQWETENLQLLRKRNQKSPGALLGLRQVLFLNIDTDAADAELANGIELRRTPARWSMWDAIVYPKARTCLPRWMP
jgi:hypothetical protein